MPNKLPYKRVYFLGIGGIGMSGLARYCLAHGMEVIGYDRTENKIVKALRNEGAQIHFSQEIKDFPELNPNTDLVVYTPAVPSSHPHFAEVSKQGLRLKKRAEFLGEISENHKVLAVAGTHGKTTTSAMLAWILKDNGKKPWAFLGGLANNFNSNYLQGDSELMVIEADEFDRSFLHLQPNAAVVTSTDADHLDIYKSHSDLLDTFNVFVEKVLSQNKGMVIAEKSTPVKRSHDYGLKAGDFFMENLRVNSGIQNFDLIHKGGRTPVELPMPGEYNALNAMAAMALANYVGVIFEDGAKSMSRFEGIYRRFEIHANTSLGAYVDDYAHHPTELKSAIQGGKSAFPDFKSLVIFQPHLFSRTRDFMIDFGKAFQGVDEVWLMPIYPAREEPIPGVSSEKLSSLVATKSQVLSSEEILKRAEEIEDKTLVMTLGAGDIDQIVQPLDEIFKRKWLKK